jgi:hypothetical protein
METLALAAATIALGGASLALALAGLRSQAVVYAVAMQLCAFGIIVLSLIA